MPDIERIVEYRALICIPEGLQEDKSIGVILANLLRLIRT